MRWDRFFEDLEDQVASEWEAERAALDSEAERLRLSRLGLGERLRQLAATASGVDVALAVRDGETFAGPVAAAGADWVAVALPVRRAAVIVPHDAIAAIGMPQADLLACARPSGGGSALAERMTFGFVVRDLSRRRVPVSVILPGGECLDGTIDRAGLDHLDIALHDSGAPRRRSAVRGFRMVPFGAVRGVRVEGSVPLV